MGRLCAFALLAVCLTAPAMAAEPLRLVANTWPPFTDRRLLNDGVATDLVRTALRRAGYPSVYIEVPWVRAIRGLQVGDYDAVVGAWYSDERAEYGHFSSPYLYNRIRFIQRKGANIHFERLTDLYPYRIAAARGYAYSKEFDEDPRLRKVGVIGFVNGAKMLSAKRVELTLEDEFVARFHLNRDLAHLRDGLEFLPRPLSENGLHLLIRRSHPQRVEIAEAFDRAIREMHDDGSYAALIERHRL